MLDPNPFFLSAVSGSGQSPAGSASRVLDVASDMIGVYEWDVTEYATEWYIPTHLLLNIYQVNTSYFLRYGRLDQSC